MAVSLAIKCSIEEFPPEILDIVFQYLNLRDLGNCSKTCVRWNQIIAELFKDKGENNFINSSICMYSID